MHEYVYKILCIHICCMYVCRYLCIQADMHEGVFIYVCYMNVYI